MPPGRACDDAPPGSAQRGWSSELTVAQLEEPFKVLITASWFEPGFRGGGPVRSLAGIIDTAPAGIDLCLVTRDRDFGSSLPYAELTGRWVARGRCRVFYLDTKKPFEWVRLWRELTRTRFDLLYVNSLWDPAMTIVPVVAAASRLISARRVLVAPHGSLSAGALSLKARKKFWFGQLWSRLLRHFRVVWHAVSETEASDITTIWPWAEVVVNGSGMPWPPHPLPPAGEPMAAARLVFIGRVSRMKNIHLTLAALSGVARPLTLDIYGPIEDSEYWKTCQDLVGALPSHIEVRYLGELAPAEVRKTFARYDAFVFPTLGENFGHVIAESLSASCPVICSDNTPWSAVLEAGGGWVVRPLTVAQLTREIDTFAALDAGQRLRARQAAGRSYQVWQKTALGPSILEVARNWPGSPSPK